ncbi:MAG: hypothetical protein LUE86_14115 [Clostridiales bacterium]|nr:hypothetical protein [Clostridiales bacterium]
MGKNGMSEKLRRLVATVLCVVMVAGTGLSSLAESGILSFVLPLASESEVATASDENSGTSVVYVDDEDDATPSNATASNSSATGSNWQVLLQARIDALPTVAEIQEDETNQLLIDTYWEVVDIMEILNAQTSVALYDAIWDEDDGSVEGGEDLNLTTLYRVTDYVLTAYARLGASQEIGEMTYVTGSQIKVEPAESKPDNTFLTLEITDSNGDETVAGSEGADSTHKNDYYSYLTGEELELKFSIGGGYPEDYVYRIYFRPADHVGVYTKEDNTSILADSTSPLYGKELQDLVTFNVPSSGVQLGTSHYAQMAWEEDLQAWYLEFNDITSANTASGTLKMTYPSPGTPGGDLDIFGVIYFKSGNSIGTSASDTSSTGLEAFDANWKTERQEFKVAITNEEQKTDGLVLSLNEENQIFVAVKNQSEDADIKWEISMTESTDSSAADNIGEDLVYEIQVTDTITLPTGITWALEETSFTATKIENGYIYFSDADGNMVTVCNKSGNTVDDDSWHLTYDKETNSLVITWLIQNTSVDSDGFVTKEISNGDWEVRLNGAYLTYSDGDGSAFAAESTHTITNEITYDCHYTWSEDDESTAEATIEISGEQAGVVLTKTADRSGTVYMGEDAYYTISLYNQGTEPITDLKTLNDNGLSIQQYISPENMWKMFFGDEEDQAEDPYLDADSGKDLTITITNAWVYYKEPLEELKTVNDMNGEATVYKTNANYNTKTEPLNIVYNTNFGGYTDLEQEVDEENSETSTLVDGNPATKTATITITKEDSGSTVKVEIVDDDWSYEFTGIGTAEELKLSLLEIGYVVTQSAKYSAVWDLSEPDNQLKAGEIRHYKVYSSLKNTFQFWEIEYLQVSSSYGTATNTVRLEYSDTEKNADTATDRYSSVQRDFRIDKDITEINGEDVQQNNLDTSVFYKGSVVRYALKIYHYGTGVAEDLPLIDETSGGQYLLVPVNEKNQESIKAGKWNPEKGDYAGEWVSHSVYLTGYEVYWNDKKITYDGEEYYVLSGEELFEVDGKNYFNWTEWPYYDVWFDDTHCASCVYLTLNHTGDTVDGLNYTITWNYDTFGGSAADNFDSIYYNMLITSNTYGKDAQNTVWLNGRYGSDYRNSALYDQIDSREILSGSLNKQILTSDASKDGDVNEETYTTYSQINLNARNGYKQTVRYKLELDTTSSTEDIVFREVKDILPDTCGVFMWNTDNVNVYLYQYASEVTDGEGNLLTGPVPEPEIEIVYIYNGTEYSETRAQTLLQNGRTVDQVICWKEGNNEQLTVPAGAGGLWIYVELTFELDASNWEEYAEAVEGDLTNTFSAIQDTYDNILNEQPDTVSVLHSLAHNPKAYLQKGVYWISLEDDAGGYSDIDSRELYCNTTEEYEGSQTEGSRIVYYIQLYNPSTSPLYLTEIQDIIPKGFTPEYIYSCVYDYNDDFAEEITNGGSTVFGTLSDPGISKIEDAEGADVTSEITWKDSTMYVTVNDGIMTYTFPENQSGGDLNYDSSVGYYYLNQNEGLAFLVEFVAGTASETEEYATNTIGMPYLDVSGAGVGVADVSGEAVNLKETSAEQNVGGCVAISESQSGEAGFQKIEMTEAAEKAGATIDVWLTSDVTVHRSGIIPGIKKTVSAEAESGIYGSDSVEWTIEVVNNGTGPMVNYTVTDVIDAPFQIEALSAAMYKKDSDQDSDLILLSIDNGLNKADWENMGQIKNQGPIFTVYDRNDEENQYQFYTYFAALDYTSSNTGYYDTWVDVKPNQASLVNNIFKDYMDGSDWGTVTDGFSWNIQPASDSKTETLAICFWGVDWAIPAGGKLVLTLTTKSFSDPADTGTYYNLATVTPTQSYEDDAVTVGEAVSTEDASDGRPYVRSSDRVYVSNGYSTGSQKWLQSNVNPDRIARSEVDNVNGVRYILLDSSDEDFRYTLEVSNQLENPMENLVIIDTLPQSGDYKAFSMQTDATARGSEFQVDLLPKEELDWQAVVGKKLDESEVTGKYDPDLQASETIDVPEDGVLTLGKDYEVLYSIYNDFGENGMTANDAVDSEAVDGDGNKIWTEDPAGARAVRIDFTKYINEDGEYGIKPNQAVQVSFNAMIASDSNAESADSTESADLAEPGEIAWNSFSYMYTTQSVESTASTVSTEGTETTENTVSTKVASTRSGKTTLWAAPRQVGIMTPAIPQLTKELNGVTAEEVTKDQTFRFLIHEGEKLSTGDYSGENTDTLEADLKEALDEAGRKYFTVELTVEAGKTTSETVYLDPGSAFVYKEDATYTIVELPYGIDEPGNSLFVSGYMGVNGVNVEGNVAEFTYQKDTTVMITADNNSIDWGLKVAKVDGKTKEAIEGVIFGLYSRTALSADALATLKADYASELSEATLETADTITVDDETWYLAGIQTTDEDGSISWTNRTDDVYYLKELKAADGYVLPTYAIKVDYWNLDEDSQELEETENGTYQIVTVTVTNTNSYLLPRSGGIGVVSVQIAGLLLMGTGAGFAYKFKNKKQEEENDD